MARVKIKKLELMEYDETTNTWTLLIPRTTGDMVVGRVNNSRKLDGKTADEFMLVKSEEPIRFINIEDNPQAICAGRMVIGNNYEGMLERTQEGELYIQGEAFAENGKKLATEDDIAELVSRLMEEIDRLRNDKPYIVSEDEPIERNKIWIKGNKAYIFDNDMWKAIGD